MVQSRMIEVFLHLLFEEHENINLHITPLYFGAHCPALL